ncbi:MAG TPA: phenylalanine--tRNA ligase subunit beta, partial [Marmoricola sp.]|nr:phenylalanine--tRNA ligase subunit beta [Marmoricola sp.]
MRAPLSWIKELVPVPDEVSPGQLADRLTALGLKLEAIHRADITGPLVVGRVLTMQPEPQKNGKTINWCTVDVGHANGSGEPQGIVCGAHNFKPGDLVVVVLPGGVLPGGFEITARKTYGHLSAGMICSGRELGISDDHEGIIVLPEGLADPGAEALPLLGLDESVIEFEINPDRAYAMSLRGVARETALGFGLDFADPADRVVPDANADGYPVRIEDPSGCPVFVARSVSGFNPSAPTPDWMVRRLEQVGQRSISLAVDVTNYVMFELGRPIHAYDADKLQGPIVVRRARAGETLTTLDGNDRNLSDEDLVVTDDSGIIGLGGVMGGESTEISTNTTNVLVESAHWDAVSMFRTGRRQKLTSEAGKRNERGVDPTVCEAAADRVVELLVAHGGGKADHGVTVVGTAPEQPEITMPSDLPGRISGLQIPAQQSEQILRQVGCTVATSGADLVVTPPAWRPDLTDPYDLVEEVVRVVGYDDIPSVLPPAPSGMGLTTEQSLRRRIGRVLAGAGYVEVVNFPFVGEADLDALGIPATDDRRDLLRLANPLSTQEPFLTSTLLPGLLRSAARNISRGVEDLALFEVAPITRGGARVAAPILPVDQRPTDEELAALFDAVPEQPLHVAMVM